jgi:hypothetical protein
MILILVPLAGCSGTDTEVTVDMDSEDLQAIIDDNRDDFLNNTTVVVFQEFHNNTSVVNQYSNNSTSNVDQSGASSSTTTYNYNGTSQQPEIFVVHFTFNGTDLFPEIEEKQNNNFTVWYSYYDYATNDDRNDQFTLACSNYYDAPIPAGNNNSGTAQPYWQNSNYYWDWWDAIYNNTIRDLLDEMAYNSDVTSNCRYEENSYNRIFTYDDLEVDGYRDWSLAPVFYSMELEKGTGFSVLSSSLRHSYTDGDNDIRDDNAGWVNNGIYGQVDSMWGGWDNLTLTFHLMPNAYEDSVYTFTMYYELYPVTVADS